MKKSKFMLAALLGLYASTSLSSAAVTPTEPQKNSDGYYLISDYAELVWFRDYVNDGNISANAKLTKDINVPSGENWYPIGVVSESTDYAGYNGTFNGCGHKIDGLCAEPTLDGVVGFFYMIEEGSGQKPFIDSLHITNATYKETTGKGRLGGGIVATMDGGRILHSSFSGSIKLSNDARVGGIAGEAATGTIKYCYSNGSLDGNKSVAGIVGDLAGEVTNCYTNATLSSSLQSAPIANKTNTRAVISDSYYAVVTKNDAGASSDADFKSGKIAYLLNKGAEPFKQTIGTDAFPSFEGETVYEYKHCTGDPRYTNDKDQQDLHHIFSDKFEAKAPTCTTKGNNVYWLCEHEPGVYYKNPNDGHYETYANESEVFIPALGHHMVEHKAEAAKCEKEGNLLYYTCVNEPGVIYANAEATKTTTLDAVTIPATGHQLEEHILEGTITCTDDEDPNYVYFTCKNDPTEFFAKDKKTRISNPQQAIDDLSGHIWGEYKFESTLENGTEDRYVRTCLRNESHKDVITSPHAFGEWQLVESEPDHDKYVHTCTSTYGSHSEEKIEKFPVEEVTYYSQKTGERDTTFRVNTEFKAIDTENDLLLAGNTTTITGNNVVAGDVCKNLVITDKVDFSTPIDFVAEELTYTRNDTARYQSFVLPYEVPMTSFNGVVYSFSEYIESRNSVKFTSVEEPSVKAGYPCILYNVKDGGKRHKIHNKLEDVILSQNLKAGAIGNNMCFYRGTFKAESGTVTKTKKYYGFKDNKFVAAGETYKLNAFRALIELHKAQGAPQASLGLIFDDELTGVTTIDAEGNFTISNVDVYDMTGRLVRKNVESATCLQGLKPGIYVVNGEKFVKTANE